MYELRDLPGVDALMKDDSLEVALSRFGPAAVKQAIRNIQKEIRDSKSTRMVNQSVRLPISNISSARFTNLQNNFQSDGTIIHSNLGRALIDPQ